MTTPKMILPFGRDGEKNIIPIEHINPSVLNGFFELKKGVPEINALPESVGGIPPLYQDMNGILNLLSQFAFYAQSGQAFFFDADYVAENGGYNEGAILMWVNDLGNTVPVRSNKTNNTDNYITNPLFIGDSWDLMADWILAQGTQINRFNYAGSMYPDGFLLKNNQRAVYTRGIMGGTIQTIPAVLGQTQSGSYNVFNHYGQPNNQKTRVWFIPFTSQAVQNNTAPFTTVTNNWIVESSSQTTTALNVIFGFRGDLSNSTGNFTKWASTSRTIALQPAEYIHAFTSRLYTPADGKIRMEITGTNGILDMPKSGDFYVCKEISGTRNWILLGSFNVGNTWINGDSKTFEFNLPTGFAGISGYRITNMLRAGDATGELSIRNFRFSMNIAGNRIVPFVDTPENLNYPTTYSVVGTGNPTTFQTPFKAWTSLNTLVANTYSSFDGFVSGVGSATIKMETPDDITLTAIRISSGWGVAVPDNSALNITILDKLGNVVYNTIGMTGWTGDLQGKDTFSFRTFLLPNPVNVGKGFQVKFDIRGGRTVIDVGKIQAIGYATNEINALLPADTITGIGKESLYGFQCKIGETLATAVNKIIFTKDITGLSIDTWAFNNGYELKYYARSESRIIAVSVDANTVYPCIINCSDNLLSYLHFGFDSSISLVGSTPITISLNGVPENVNGTATYIWSTSDLTTNQQAIGSFDFNSVFAWLTSPADIGGAITYRPLDNLSVIAINTPLEKYKNNITFQQVNGSSARIMISQFYTILGDSNV